MNDHVKKRNEQLAEEFFTLCNVMGNEKYLIEALRDRLDRQHRTVIQCSMGVIKDLVGYYAENHNADLRNQDSLEWAKAVAKNDTGFRYI